MERDQGDRKLLMSLKINKIISPEHRNKKEKNREDKMTVQFDNKDTCMLQSRNLV